MTDSLKRRQFLKLTSGTALSGLFLSPRLVAEESIGSIYQRIVPARKDLDAAWALSLAKRGAPRDAGIECSEKKHLPHIGMTVGGIGCGTVYLSGDGRLYVWDIFHQAHVGVVSQQVKVPDGLENIAGAGKLVRELDGANYISPPTPESHPNPFKQGFTLHLEGTEPRSMDGAGWSNVKFTGRWPLGIVEYTDPACPVAVRLESWSPFIPLSTLDSSLPVTVMEYTLENTSDKVVTGQLAGEWENPVLIHTRKRRKAEVDSRIVNESGLVMLLHESAREKAPEVAKREDIVFEDFEKETYGAWAVEGNAFGTGPVAADSMPAYQGKVAGQGKRLVNSHASAPGDGVGGKDDAKGVLTSPEFVIARRHIRMLLGGGNRPGETGVEVLVDGKVVASAAGRDNNRMAETSMDVSAFEGRKARLRIIDRAAGPWGNTGADQIVFSDTPAGSVDLKDATDHGTAALVLLGEHSQFLNGNGASELTALFSIPPSGKTTIRFLLTWHFPNMRDLPGLGKQVPQYASRFPDAAAVAREVAKRFTALREATMRWVEVWNDSTLPQWLLDRAVLTTNTLQTTNCHVLATGRFWAWEGVGCCAGTCAHVWHYAQGVARLFPELERNLREVTDFGVAMNPDGSIRFRAEAAGTVAIDSQTGIILRTWREHLVSTDNDFLKRVWPGAKRALEWLIRFDKDGRGGLDGLLDGMQHNTLDAEWYGKVHCLCSLYLAALRAGREMAMVAGDSDFAATCDRIHALGAEKISTLFNGEFYIQDEDPAHAGAIGVGQGCYIDQVIGQWWATQTGLGRIYSEGDIRKALHALWRYNFVPEIGSFRQVFKLGRFYAMPNEAGLIMCTWPKGGLREDFKKHWQYAYFNECMSGFEWQAAAHMVQEGDAISAADFGKTGGFLENPADTRSLTARGLAVGRAIHDRYSPALRNPYNEIECSDHYARANASYSLFLAACGFHYDGPAGVIGFAPKLAPEDFKAPFTASEGWGTFEQKQGADGKWTARIKLARGRLVLKEIRLPWLASAGKVQIVSAVPEVTFGKGFVKFASAVTLTENGPELLVSTP